MKNENIRVGSRDKEGNDDEWCGYAYMIACIIVKQKPKATFGVICCSLKIVLLIDYFTKLEVSFLLLKGRARFSQRCRCAKD
jgi:hypothetical protein